MIARTVKVKPHYLGLLNGISVGEGRGGVLLRAWADATCDEQLKECLSFVACRETDHSEVFAARVQEFGFEVRESADTTGELCALLASEATDAEKVRAWNSFFAPPAPQPDAERSPSLEDRLSDPSIDRTTRTLLRWYLDEEIDSGRRLREAFARVTGGLNGSNGTSAAAPGKGQDAKPSFLGLLNTISVLEGRGGQILQAWAGATKDPDLKACLCLVAERETNHHDVFKGRIEELGYALIEEPAGEDFQKALAFYASEAPDCEKAARSQANTGDDVDGQLAALEQQIAGPDFDPVTRRLLSWFIGEERDSGQKLAEAYACVMESVAAS